MSLGGLLGHLGKIWGAAWTKKSDFAGQIIEAGSTGPDTATVRY